MTTPEEKIAMDLVFGSFLHHQFEEAAALADGSDLFRVGPLSGEQLVVCEFRCRGLVRRSGSIEEADHFVVGFHFGRDYLRRANPPEILTMILPNDVWHPNIGGARSPGAICIGRISPGTPLVELIHRVYELITWQTYSTLEYDTLQPEACQWARANADRFPIDPRPLRWHAADHASDGAFVLAEARDLLDAIEVVE